MDYLLSLLCSGFGPVPYVNAFLTDRLRIELKETSVLHNSVLCVFMFFVCHHSVRFQSFCETLKVQVFLAGLSFTPFVLYSSCEMSVSFRGCG